MNADEPVNRTPVDGERASRADRVHVVTVTHNSSATLDRYFAGLAVNASRVAAVTVVDNGSSDSTAREVDQHARTSAVPVRLIRNANTGFAGGYLAAAGAPAVGEAPVLCVNPDVQLAAGAIEALLDALNSFADCGIVTAPLVEIDGTPDTASRRRLPTLTGSMVYSVLGRSTPKRLRYNQQEESPIAPRWSARGVQVSELEATTGALMLVHPDFRRLEQGIFDIDYWMYGEDLQLCADARSAGRVVLMAEVPPSVHVKGVSSGRPRSRVANRAFHDAMLMYATKNLVRSRSIQFALRIAVALHFFVSELRSLPARRAAARRR